MNKGYAAVRLFFLAKKIKPKAANPSIMAKPTPQVRPMPLVSQIVEVDGKKLLDGVDRFNQVLTAVGLMHRF